MSRLPPSLAAATVFFYALGYPIGALAVHSASPGLVLTARFGLAPVILGIVVLVKRYAWPHGGRQFGHAAVVGLLTQATQFIAAYEAMRLGVSPVLVALIIATNPAITAAAASGLLGERLSKRRVVAVVLALCAVGAAFAGRVAQVGGIDPAVALVLVAVTGLALGGIYQQRFLRSGHPIANNAIGSAVALIPTAIFAALTPFTVSDGRTAAVSITVMVLASAVVGTTLYVAAIQRAGASASALLFGLIPSVSAILTWAIMGERPDAGVVAGLVLGAAACAVGRPRPAESNAEGHDTPETTNESDLESGMRLRHMRHSRGQIPGCALMPENTL